jgi:hypothetical protein
VNRDEALSEMTQVFRALLGLSQESQSDQGIGRQEIQRDGAVARPSQCPAQGRPPSTGKSFREGIDFGDRLRIAEHL